MANYQKSKNTASTKSEAKKSSVTHGQVTESILIKKTRLFLNREPQSTPSGRQIIYSACSMNAQIPAKYINREYKHHWIYSFKYIDDDTFVHFEFDYNGVYIGKC